MSSVNTITGRFGRFVVAEERVARITKWSLKETLATKSEWGDSDTGGYTARAAGRQDATFEAEGKYDHAGPCSPFNLFSRGDIAEAILWMSIPDGAESDQYKLFYLFPRALCMDFNVVVDVETEQVVGWTSSWGADGKFWRPYEVGRPDKDYPLLVTDSSGE